MLHFRRMLFILDCVYKHLEKPNSHAKILFADFSSAFNKMQPHILIEHLASHFKLPDQLLRLFLDFLTDRVQQVSVNGHMSTSVISSTGSPQGCVLSPLLFIMYTDSCRSPQESSSSFFVKFSDDTALLSLLQGEEHIHGHSLPFFVKWCDNNYLDLNITKTKEIVIDFRTCGSKPKASIIHDEEVQILDT